MATKNQMGRSLSMMSSSDAELKHRVVYGVADEMLSIDPAAIAVEVRRGVVTLAGTVPDRVTAELFQHVVERLPGVAAVSAMMTWPEGVKAAEVWPYEPPPDVDDESREAPLPRNRPRVTTNRA